jgi:hypothetical protein
MRESCVQLAADRTFAKASSDCFRRRDSDLNDLGSSIDQDVNSKARFRMVRFSNVPRCPIDHSCRKELKCRIHQPRLTITLERL